MESTMLWRVLCYGEYYVMEGTMLWRVLCYGEYYVMESAMTSSTNMDRELYFDLIVRKCLLNNS